MPVTVENCTSVNVFVLQKSIKKCIDRDYPNSTQEDIFKTMQTELSAFTLNGQVFEYEAVPNYLGGYRWFFKCPKCKIRASKLFLPPETATGLEQKYYCKNCHHLKNQSALMGQNNMYRKVTRPLKKMKEIEDRINKGHLKADKVQELLDQYEALEKQLKDSPEFRLYTFKKTHKTLN